MIDGLLIEVRADERSTAATAAVAVGGAAVPVEDLTPFGDDGGQVDIAGTVYDYSGIDSSAVNADGEGGSVLLASPLTAAVEEFDPVAVLVGDAVAVDFYAVVSLGDDDESGEPIEVPLETRGERVAWPVKVYDPPLPVSLSDDLLSIQAAPGVTPEINGTLSAVPLIYAAKGGQQTIPTDTWTTVNGWFVFPSDRITVDTTFGYMFTVEVDGWYDLRLGVTFALNSTGSRAIRPHIYGVDGSDKGPMRQVKIPADGSTTVETAQLVRLVAGQRVTFEVWQSSTGDLEINGSQVLIEQAQTDCSIRWVGPL